MRYIFNLANSTDGLNSDCIANSSSADAWKCNFAQMAYAHTKARIFPLNSALDSWQTVCIYAAELPEGFPHQNNVDNGECATRGTGLTWAPCAKDPEKCSASEMAAMNGYVRDFQTIMHNTTT